MAYSFMDLASDILKSAGHPLTYQEIWQAGMQAGFAAKVSTAGKTPWNTLGAQLYVDVRDNDASRFIKTGKRPARFFLKSRGGEITDEVTARIETAVETPPRRTIECKERDLHSVLTYFAYADPAFNRGRPVYTGPRSNGNVAQTVVARTGGFGDGSLGELGRGRPRGLEIQTLRPRIASHPEGGRCNHGPPLMNAGVRQHKFCDRIPVHVRADLTNVYRFRGNSVILIERRPYFGDRTRHTEHEFAKFVYSPRIGGWSLRWRDRNGRWHSYDGFQNVPHLRDVLAEVASDPTGIFLG